MLLGEVAALLDDRHRCARLAVSAWEGLVANLLAELPV
jgi:hypothetical protein